MNSQPPSKAHLDPGGILAIRKIFYTIQGEGPFAGVPAVFVRLAGCNLQCPMCDTDYSSVLQYMDPDDVLDEVHEVSPYRNDSPGTLVVISGGEPFLQNIAPVAKRLLDEGYRVQVETNGTLSPGNLPSDVVVVCSPKTARLHPVMAARVNHFKYVLDAGDTYPPDGLPRSALHLPVTPRVARPPSGFTGTVYLQPVDTGDEVQNRRHRDAVIHNCMRHGYTMCLQLHKLVNLE